MIHITRKQKLIFDIVQKNPGINYVLIAEELKMNSKTVYYHGFNMINKKLLFTENIRSKDLRKFWIVPDARFVVLTRTKNSIERIESIKNEEENSCLHRQTIFTNGAQPEGQIDVGCNEGEII